MHLRLIREGVFILIFSGVLAAQAGSQSKYMDISFSSLFAVGWASAKEPALRQLQGGAHDPRQRGFGVQNLELSFAGAVDPYLNGEAHLIIQIDETGESILEVEEAFLTTLSMPLALQVKAGTFFTEFGRLNPQHPHSWSFVDQPLISTRMMGGDGLRGPAARLSWLSPLPWYAEFLLGAHNPRVQFSVRGARVCRIPPCSAGPAERHRPGAFRQMAQFRQLGPGNNVQPGRFRSVGSQLDRD